MTEHTERDLRVAVVVPCFNEAGRLDASVWLHFLEPRPWLRFAFVDDGSRDGTAALLASLESARPDQVQVLSLAENRGKGEAVRRGLLALLDAPPAPPAAEKNVAGGAADPPELVGFWDADLATSLSELDRFVDAFAADARLEMLLGSRVQLLGHHIERNPLRHYMGRVVATLVTHILGVAVYDTQCGAKLFRATDTLRRLLAQPFLTRWIFDVEMLARWLELRPDDAARMEVFVREMPVGAWRDVRGSRLGAIDFLRVPRDLLRIYVRYRRRAEHGA